MKIKRRTFLQGMVAAGTAAALTNKVDRATADVSDSSYATLIDLTKCDGCPDQDTPACVMACRAENEHKYPEPDPAMLKPYWPQTKFEDWSNKRDVTNRLTPYNWIFVQKVNVEVDGEMVETNIPRRCMHCDNPPCVKLCPFGANVKMKEGPVYINPDICFGGAKCRDVCPWSVPQRQAGVGIYTKLDPIPAGGGVMYQCDMCKDRLAEGKVPACIEECPQEAMVIGTRSEIFAKAEELRQQYDGYIYGDKQMGGTGTLYVSQIPFEKIDEAIVSKADDPEKAMRVHDTPYNVIDNTSHWSSAALLAPVAGAIGAFAATVAVKKRNKQEDAHNENN
ncbi:4Fe-4S dicluster domain-containing protein [Anaerolineales bacterium HSG6]|nr:4Fe-4S dicluster domain-containing protein [Anaerolineales bacterium HSG6]